MPDIRIEPAPLSSGISAEIPLQQPRKTVGKKAFKIIGWTCIGIAGLGAALLIAGTSTRSAMTASRPTLIITPEIMQACEKSYSESAEAALDCAKRVALRQKFEDESARDQQAAKDAETIRIYGSLEAAQKSYAEGERIDRLCTRSVGLDNTQAWIKCEELHDTFRPRRVASH